MSEMIVNSNNKIISREMLLDFFEAMHNELEQFNKIAAEEQAKNEPLKDEYQKWTLKGFYGSLEFSIYFLDNHNVSYDNYYDFISVFKNQSYSIDRIYVHYYMSYTKVGGDNHSTSYPKNSINLTIDNDKLEVSSDLSSQDTYLNDTYNLILQKISSAPPKFDHIIKAKEFISFKIGLPLGLTLGSIAILMTVFIPEIRGFYRRIPYIFPLLQFLLGVSASVFIGSARTSASYAKLIPQKYAGYNPNTKSSYYNDDFKKLTETSEVLIGEKSNNLTIKTEIAANEKKSAKLIPIALGIWAITCLIGLLIVFLS